MHFFNSPGAHGSDASERPVLGNSRRKTTNVNYNEETNTTLPFYSDKDYLLTLNPIQYSLLVILRQKLDNSRFLVNVNVAAGSFSETLYIIVIQNRTVSFHRNNSIFGLFKLANVSLWQKLVVSFNHREISVTQECAEYSFLSVSSKPKLEEWEKVTVTVQVENSQGDTQVCNINLHLLVNLLSLTFFWWCDTTLLILLSVLAMTKYKCTA